MLESTELTVLFTELSVLFTDVDGTAEPDPPPHPENIAQSEIRDACLKYVVKRNPLLVHESLGRL